MIVLFFTVYLLFSFLGSLTEANSNHLPRMTFTDKETTTQRFPLPDDHLSTRIVLEEESGTVTAAGQKHLISFNIQSPLKTLVKRKLLWKECSGNKPSQRECNYSITVLHKMEEANQLFVCGTSGMETVCCDVNLSQQSPMCIPSEKIGNITGSISEFIIKEGEPSALVESEESADLYLTYSGSEMYVGLHKFGKNRVGPATHNKEQHYVGLVLSRQGGSPSQDKVYAFYKEKNRDTGLYSEMWLPFVSQVCMTDTGGPKNTLQFSWTSQMNARLFCGDPDSKQHFSELVDVAAVHADHWQDTRIYALFRNEWGMSAVCVYTIRDINNIFKTSPFKVDGTSNPVNRSRMCVLDSKKIPSETLKMIEMTSEMEQWVRPVNLSGPLLFNHHSYTRIYVDSSQHKRKSQVVLYLSLLSGGIHKVLQNKSQTFVIAEYQPFTNRSHIISIVLHPHSRKLYINSRRELVQLDVAICAQYGDSCEECALARDPYCGWNGTHCSAETKDTRQDVIRANHAMCVALSKDTLPGKVFRHSTDPRTDEDVNSIRLPSQSKYFLQCPILSHHAKYTWRYLKSSTPCSSREQQCLLLIDSMGPEQEGIYQCVSEEMGYSRVRAQYQLLLEGRAAGHSSSALLWVCLVAVLLVLSK